MQQLVKDAQAAFRRASPAFEEMGGVVAGVKVKRPRRRAARERDGVGQTAEPAREAELV